MNDKWWISIAFIAMFLVGCQSAEQFSPEQVMEKAMESGEEETPYYGEMTMTVTDDDDTFEITSKEWRKGNQSLEEVVVEGDKMTTLKNGEVVMIYDEVDNTVMETEFEEGTELNLSSKERLEKMLELVEDTHTLEKKADEKIAGRDAMHLVAEKKPDKKSLFGDQEIWIDKENWLVLKTIDQTEDNQSVMEYTKIEMEPKMSDDIFTLDLPDDVEVESLDDYDMEKEITLEEGMEILEESFLYLDEQDGLTLDKVTHFDMEEEGAIVSIDLHYELAGLPYLDLSVMKIEDEEEIDDGLSEEIDIRGYEGSYVDLDGAHMVTWTEGGFQYNAWFINPNISIEEMQEQLEEMEEVTK